MRLHLKKKKKERKKSEEAKGDRERLRREESVALSWRHINHQRLTLDTKGKAHA
jgi:hypothetical protein